MRFANKTITYKLKATDEKGVLQQIDDAAEVQLPSIEKLTDTIKGAGILGEIDFPSFGQIGAMSFTINNRSDGKMYAILSRPGAIKFELVWIVDVLDSATNSTVQQVNKAFITAFNKTYDPGKIEIGAGSEGSSEYEVVYYRRIVDGREILLIDKLNYKYVINGVDYLQSVRNALA